MSCPAAITIAGIEYFCQNDSDPHFSLTRHWTIPNPESGATYWTQVVMPPKPPTLVEWLEQEVPSSGLHGNYSIGYRAGRQAVLDAATRWRAPFVAPAPVDLDALIEVIRPHTYGKVMPTTVIIAEAVIAHLRLETK